MKIFGIYKIKNISNNKIYIGSSTDCKQRFRQHLYLLFHQKHGNTHLQSAYNKYGKDSFEFSIIEKNIDSDKLIEKEQYYVNLYQCFNPLIGYNKKQIVNSSYGYKHTKESKNKMSISKKGKKQSKEVIIQRGLSIKQRFSEIPKKKSPVESNIKGGKLRSQRFFNPIIQFDLNGTFIKEFKTIKETSVALNIKHANISAVIRKVRKKAGNFYFCKKIETVSSDTY